MKLSKLKLNPNNPRKVLEGRGKTMLLYKLLAFPNILKVRKVAYDSSDKNVVLGGNQRTILLREVSAWSIDTLKDSINEASTHFNTDVDESLAFYSKVIKTKSLPSDCVIDCVGMSEDEKKAFVFIDNVNDGDYDFDVIEGWDFDVNELMDLGVDFEVEEDNEESNNGDNEEYDKSRLSSSGNTYLNSTIRQIVLAYDIDSHKDVLLRLETVASDYDCKGDNSTTLIKLIEFYEDDRSK